MILLDKLKDEHLGWVIGMLEGEGCFTNRSNGTYALELKSVDEDMATKFALLTGCKLSGPYKPKSPKHQPIYRIYVGKKNGLDELLEFIYPYMGKRRQSQIDDMFNRGEYEVKEVKKETKSSEPVQQELFTEHKIPNQPAHMFTYEYINSFVR